jgi:hypothetical protein
MQKSFGDRTGGESVPGAEAPYFSVAGNARTEVRAYLRSNNRGKSNNGGEGEGVAVS